MPQGTRAQCSPPGGLSGPGPGWTGRGSAEAAARWAGLTPTVAWPAGPAGLPASRRPNSCPRPRGPSAAPQAPTAAEARVNPLGARVPVSPRAQPRREDTCLQRARGLGGSGLVTCTLQPIPCQGHAPPLAWANQGPLPGRAGTFGFSGLARRHSLLPSLTRCPPWPLPSLAPVLSDPCPPWPLSSLTSALHDSCPPWLMSSRWQPCTRVAGRGPGSWGDYAMATCPELDPRWTQHGAVLAGEGWGLWLCCRLSLPGPCPVPSPSAL